MRKKLIWLAIVIVVLLIAWRVYALVSTPPISKAQAIQIAKDYANRVGWSFRAPDKVALQNNSISPKRIWRIGFLKDKFAWIDADTGFVYRIWLNSEFSRSKESPHIGSAVPKISAKQARAIAERLLDRIGRRKDCRFKKIEKNKDPTDWWITWERVWHDIPYRYDGMMITIDANTGQFTSYTGICITIPPQSSKVIITKKAALDKAAIVAREHDIPMGIGAKQANLAIVGAGLDDWSSYKGETRVVWVIATHEPDDFTEIWIDAETGKYLGGSNYN
jgi:hypothetical protein